MIKGVFHTAYSSARFYKKDLSLQFIIVVLLSAIITGSLLTGFSVRESLRKGIDEKLGNSSIYITSGLRYFTNSLPTRFEKEYEKPVLSVLQTEGFAEKFGENTRSDRVKVTAVAANFFTGLGWQNTELQNGEVIINNATADYLHVNKGDEIILTLTVPDDLPPGSPFAPLRKNSNSGVFRVSRILDATNGGNFSTAISQVAQHNVFMRSDEPLCYGKLNCILIPGNKDLNATAVTDLLATSLRPSDTGLRTRKVPATGGSEIISGRIFLDSVIVDQLTKNIQGAKPAITWLANSISRGDRSTPYSFVSALSDPVLPNGDSIVINTWLADDLQANPGDTVNLSWFYQSESGKLLEKSHHFVISRIVSTYGQWKDSLLMPEFPGISGSKTCTEWDAGVEIKTDRIRDKDEKYWNRFRGTPKAYISYQSGVKAWGNNFGPATTVRLPYELTGEDLDSLMAGKTDPGSSGFYVRNLRDDMTEAAESGVDFGSLFLGLSFFIIVSCFVALVLITDSWFSSRKKQVLTYRSVGYRDSLIMLLLLAEVVIPSILASLTGGLAGIAVSAAFVTGLNSVWSGAVQTNALSAYPSWLPVLTGIASTSLLMVIFLWLRTRKFLRESVSRKKTVSSPRLRKTGLIISLILVIVPLGINLFNAFFLGNIITGYISGIILFAGMTNLWYQFVIHRNSGNIFSDNIRFLSSKYYAFHPGRAVIPVLLISAGLFAVVITGINRLKLSDESLSEKGGTGGLALWTDLSVPVQGDISPEVLGKKLGLQGDEFGTYSITGGKRVNGDDASCLNLNYVASPPLLGIDPLDFMSRNSFSFSSVLNSAYSANPWKLLDESPGQGVIYGFADQTVLEWGLKKKIGDTLRFRSENGTTLKVVIAGALKPSVFQGYIIVSGKFTDRYYPSTPGYSVLMIRCERNKADTLASAIRSGLEGNGASVSKAGERLATFYTVTNTYLQVFNALGVFGMILGIAGLGFVLARNYSMRRKEFALLLATGFTLERIRRILMKEQVEMLIAGIVTGVISGIASSSASVNNISEIPWTSILVICLASMAAGITSLLVSLKSINEEGLVPELRKE